MIKYMNPHCITVVPSAMGDTIGALPIVKYAYEKIFKKDDLKIYIQPYFRDLFWFVADEHIRFYDGNYPKFDTFHKFINYVDENKDMKNQKLLAQRLSLVDFASLRLFSILLQGEDKNYVKLPIENTDISKFELPEKYVCILSIRNFENRSLPEKTIDDLVNYFLDKGITPVLLGKTSKEVYAGKSKSYGYHYGEKKGVINLVNKTSIYEVAKVMNESICVIGADTGLTHVAGMTDAKVICGFTTIRPELREPQRYGIPSWNWYSIIPEDGCRFCNTDWYIGKMSWDICEDNNLECMNWMTADRFIKVFEQVYKKE